MLDAMKSRVRFASIGGIVYLLLGVFAAAVLLIWVGDAPISSFSLLSTIPGGTRLFIVLVCLSLASFSIGIYLLRHPPNPVVICLCFLLAAIAILWNYISVLFWLWPIIFVWTGR